MSALTSVRVLHPWWSEAASDEEKEADYHHYNTEYYREYPHSAPSKMSWSHDLLLNSYIPELNQIIYLLNFRSYLFNGNKLIQIYKKQ